MEKNKKTILFIIAALFLVSTSFGIISAKDSYSIKANQVIFSLSSSEGIYPVSYIFKENQKIDTIRICETDKCSGKLSIA